MFHTKRIGTQAEWEVRKILEQQGYFVGRSAGSKGIWDLWAVNENGLRLIQVKSTSQKEKAKILFKKDIERMKNTKVFGQQELWVRRKGKKVKEPIERYEIIKIQPEITQL
jgi:Holliday junction resolvase